MLSKEVENKYLELVCIKRICTYEGIGQYLNITEKDAKCNYNKLIDFYLKELVLDYSEYKNLEEKMVEEKNKIDKLFNNQWQKRKEGFEGDFEIFYRWYQEQDDRCFYCGTTASELKELFNPSKNEPPKIYSEKFNETLHIERLRPKENYTKDNCRLACCLCNNAKSDLLNAVNFKNYLAPQMKLFLKDLLDGKISNFMEN